MRSFKRGVNLVVFLAFVGIPASEAISITVPGNERPDNPAAWNLIFPGLEEDSLRAAENISNSAWRISLNGQPFLELEKVSGGLPEPPTGWRKQAEESVPDKHLRPPSDPEDDLARFVSQMMAPGCGQACSDFAMTYSLLTSPAPSGPEDELAQFVSLMRVAECVSIGPMQFYSAVTYSQVPFRVPFRFKGRMGRIH